MSLWVPVGGLGGFQYVVGNALSTRPNAAFGTSVTPVQNASNGTFAQLISGANVLQDLYGLRIEFNSGTVNGQTRDTLATIGVDANGGSSYSDLITDLLCSCSTGLNLSTGTSYYFPIFVKAGSSIGCRGSVNNATVGTFRCVITGFGQPLDPRSVKCGSFVETIGSNISASNGTAVTSGTTNDGAWTSLGSTAKQTWWFQQGFGCSSSAMIGGVYAADLSVGDGSSFDILLRKMMIQTSNAETISYGPHFGNNVRRVPGGSTIYGRLQCSASVDTGTSMIAYALGG